MSDTVSKETRSRIMRQIRSKGNISTELKLRMLLVRSGISGWRLHEHQLPGKPDFVFPELRLAIFTDGCFWHGCPECGHIPKSNQEYWKAKIQKNINRDQANRSQLRQQGWIVLRFWEHELANPKNVLTRINRITKHRNYSS